MTDTLISDGLIVDGTGAPPFIGDVHITDDRIVKVSPHESKDSDHSLRLARNTIDASGLMVTPGFIDIHSHSDHTLVVDPRAFSSVNQGVTLEVVGNCGFGCFPVEDPQ